MVRILANALRTTSKQDANETTNTIPTHVGNMIGIRSHRTREKSTRCKRSVKGTGEVTSCCLGRGIDGVVVWSTENKNPMFGKKEKSGQER